MDFSIQTSCQTINAYLHSVKDRQYVTDNENQRGFVKNTEWKSNLIFFIMWSGEVPGKIYYHPVIHENGSKYYASLDGKGRTSALEEFMENKFPLGKNFEVPGLEHLYGIEFGSFSEKDKSRLKSAKVTLAEFDRHLSDDEFNVFFHLIKTPSDCKTGEELHSDLSSPNRKMLDTLKETSPDFKEFIEKVWGPDPRFDHIKVVARCLSYRMEGVRKYYKPTELYKFWHVGVPPAIFKEVTNNMLKAWVLKKNGLKIKRFESEVVFCPFFLLYNEAVPVETVRRIVEAWDEDTQFGDSTQRKKANASEQRYKHLVASASSSV
jgi:hypothetical protein